MARHRKYEAAEESNPALDISSLIDVCFLLLIYFIVTSTITPRESDLGMALPAANPSTGQPEIEPMFIRIEANGAIYTGSGASQQAMDSDTSVRELPLLRGQLDMYASAARAANSKPLVQIYADGEASQQRVIDVLNALAGVNINSVTFTDLVN
ncbi:MAG: biopolymer transporter ExbD [Verrucomicrobiaceae bacterium]|jgi:biopolymer transport protein ExbD|nr:MAG: biopolymer transporter ExbD [Verrucomicrobiaceae bacterium]